MISTTNFILNGLQYFYSKKRKYFIFENGVQICFVFFEVFLFAY